MNRDGSTFHAGSRRTAFTYPDQPCLLGVVRDVSRRVQSEQRRHQHIETRPRAQSALLEISQITVLREG